MLISPYFNGTVSQVWRKHDSFINIVSNVDSVPQHFKTIPDSFILAKNNLQTWIFINTECTSKIQKMCVAPAVQLPGLVPASLTGWCQLPSIKALNGTPPRDIHGENHYSVCQHWQPPAPQIISGKQSNNARTTCHLLGIFFSCKLLFYRSFWLPHFFKTKEPLFIY